MQDCEDFESCRKFIAEKLAVHLIIDIKTVKTGELKIKLGFNQLDPIMTEQESKGLRIRKIFSIEEIIQDFYIKKFDCMIDVHSPKRKLAVEVDELGYLARDQIIENKRQKELEEYLGYTFIRINPHEKDFSAYDGLGKTFIDKLKDEKLEKLKDKKN